jgi:hypothetical protein
MNEDEPSPDGAKSHETETHVSEKLNENPKMSLRQESIATERSSLNSSFSSFFERSGDVQRSWSNLHNPVYNDTIPPDAPFWVEINPIPDIERDTYNKIEEEFNIVGIIGDIGEGDEVQYEVQFEDYHTATVNFLIFK